MALLDHTFEELEIAPGFVLQAVDVALRFDSRVGWSDWTVDVVYGLSRLPASKRDALRDLISTAIYETRAEEGDRAVLSHMEEDA